MNYKAPFKEEIVRFGALLHDSEHTQLKVEEKKLSLEERCLKIDVQERHANRDERHRE